MMDYRADRKVRDFSGENHIGSVISSYHKMWLQLSAYQITIDFLEQKHYESISSRNVSKS